MMKKRLLILGAVVMLLALLFGVLPANAQPLPRTVGVLVTDPAPSNGELQLRVQYGYLNQVEGWTLKVWHITAGQYINNEVVSVEPPKWVRLWWKPEGSTMWYLLPSQYWQGDHTSRSEYGVDCMPLPGGLAPYVTSFSLAIPESDVPLIEAYYFPPEGYPGYCDLETATSAAGSCGVHVVAPGENLYRIALRYDVPLDTLAAYNHIVAPDRIFVGMEIRVPSGTGQAAVVASEGVVAVGGSVHAVAPGENLFRISLQYGLPLASVAAYNGIPAPYTIHVGQQIRIPAGVHEAIPAPAVEVPTAEVVSPAGVRIHVVAPGENLFRISLQYGLPFVSVAAYNGIPAPYTIHVGQEIRIP
ncbi:MAG: LysM peptidoglycan-binding domain-containing protein [Anaerolineae bacterium]|nr:LysM peptidoglycan-binding domain-containing protein [Anaerolineae bacterium]